jgi:hypothetical protein
LCILSSRLPLKCCIRVPIIVETLRKMYCNKQKMFKNVLKLSILSKKYQFLTHSAIFPVKVIFPLSPVCRLQTNHLLHALGTKTTRIYFKTLCCCPARPTCNRAIYTISYSCKILKNVFTLRLGDAALQCIRMCLVATSLMRSNSQEKVQPAAFRRWYDCTTCQSISGKRHCLLLQVYPYR